jgi:hypothetical protein
MASSMILREFETTMYKSIMVVSRVVKMAKQFPL